MFTFRLFPGEGWAPAPEFIPPYHISADGHEDLSVRFVDLNGDGRDDMVYHRVQNRLTVNRLTKGAYINNGHKWIWSPQFTPPFHIAADGVGDLGAKFVDLNADSRVDLVYHRKIDSKVVLHEVPGRAYLRY